MAWLRRPADLVPGKMATGMGYEDVLDAISFLMSPPTLQMRQTAAQSIPNSAYAIVLFDTEDIDTVSGHSTTTNTSRWTLPSADMAGWYRCVGKVAWSGNVTGRRASLWSLNGTAINGSEVIYPVGTSSAVEHVTAEIIVPVTNAGDYIELQIFQDSGGALNTNVSSGLAQTTAVITWQGAF